MAKQSGLADLFLVDGSDLSGDVGAIQKIGMPRGLLESTGLDKSAEEKLYGLRDGEIVFNSYYNDVQEHVVLKTLSASDRFLQYHRGRTLGAPAASLYARQVNYDWQRTKDGALVGSIQGLGDGYGTEWGESLTAGIRTDTAATSPATGVDGQLLTGGLVGASSAFGAAAYLALFSFGGTSATIKIQDSADNSAFADIPGMTFTIVTLNIQHGERVETVTLTSTVRRYVRVITTGVFGDCKFAVNFVRYLGARDA